MTTSEPNQRKRRKRRFDPAFKEEAIELGRRIGIVQASKDLGISESCLRKWAKTVEAKGKQTLLPMSQRTDLEAENRRLREEFERIIDFRLGEKPEPREPGMDEDEPLPVGAWADYDNSEVPF